MAVTIEEIQVAYLQAHQRSIAGFGNVLAAKAKLVRHIMLTKNAKERVVGSLLVYERFAGYVPRTDGTPDWTAGPKIAHFDRVEWHVIPDPATAAAALQTGEIDWWENPTADLLPSLRAVKGLRAVAAMNCSSVALKKFLLRSHSAGKVLDSIVRCCFGC